MEYSVQMHTCVCCIYSCREASFANVGLDTSTLEDNVCLVLTTFMAMTRMEMKFVMIVTTVQNMKTLTSVMRMETDREMSVMRTLMEMVR